MRRFWVELGIIVLGIGIACVAYWLSKRGQTHEAKMLEADHTDRSLEARLRVIYDDVARLESSDKALSGKIVEKLKEATRVEEAAKKDHQLRGLDAETIALRFSRIHRKLGTDRAR